MYLYIYREREKERKKERKREREIDYIFDKCIQYKILKKFVTKFDYTKLLFYIITLIVLIAVFYVYVLVV